MTMSFSSSEIMERDDKPSIIRRIIIESIAQYLIHKMGITFSRIAVSYFSKLCLFIGKA